MEILINVAETKILKKFIEPKFKVGDIIQGYDGSKVEITEVDIDNERYLFRPKIFGMLCALDFKNQDKWELVPNKNMRTQETQEQKEQRVKSIIESYKIINKDYVLIQIHDEVILCFPNKESALQSLKKDIMYNKRKDEVEMVNFYLYIYFRINEGQRMFDYNGENKMEVCGNEEVICK